MLLNHEENNMDIDQACNEWKDCLMDSGVSVSKMIRASNNRFHEIAADVEKINVI